MPVQTLRPEFIAELESLCKRGGRFHVGLGSGVSVDLDAAEYRNVCTMVIDPLIRTATECWLFDQPDNELLMRFAPNALKVGRRYSIDLTRNVTEGFEGFWGADCGQRGTVVWKSCVNVATLGRIFEGTRDPGFLTNIKTIAGNAAVNYAHRETALQLDTIVFMLPANRGVNELHVFSDPENAVRLLHIALKHCRKSGRFLNLYGG